MDPISFDKLLLKTAFCCMASDGHIDNLEISRIKSMCEKSLLLKDLDFHEEINLLVSEINTAGKAFINQYFDLLGKTNMSEQEELVLIDYAIQTIIADEQIEYSEIKFFKNIRHRLKVSDDSILAVFPDIEQFLEDDIVTESFLDKTTIQYLQAAELPQFDLISIDTNSIDDLKKNE
jgi:uncharacterized tellurite resistance protein B-like protein